jgi:membrane protein implicated in regulation of membrane protease activity
MRTLKPVAFKMKDSSARAAVCFSAILILVGMMVMSPSGAFALFVPAAIFAGIPLLFGSGRMRIIAIALFILSVVLAVGNYHQYKDELNRLSKPGRESGLQNSLKGGK